MRPTLRTACLLLATAFIAPPVGAADFETFHVNPETGADTNPGTKEKPFKTLPAAADRVNELKTEGAATLVLSPGTYALDRQFSLKANRKYTKADRLTIRAEELNHSAGMRRLFAAFGLEPGPGLDRAVGRPLNARDEWPRRPRAELTAPPAFPSADPLSAAERDRLLVGMVAYLRRTRAREVAGMRPDDRLAGTRLLAATRLVAEAEPERAFGRALAFTDAERVLVH